MSRQATQRKLERLLGKHAILPASEKLLRGEGIYLLDFTSYKQMAEARKLCIRNDIAAEQKDYGAAGPFRVEVYLGTD